MKHLDLFSGIGGFALAARWAGIQTVGFCEIEEYPRKVLAKNLPGVPIHHDIRELDGNEYESIDIITGGYPCQPFSTAGKRKGQEDDRHLWPEMLRVITQARPAWVIAENVAGHITMGLDQVLADLEGEGYTSRTVVIPAVAVDAKHRRDRVWVLGSNAERLRGSKQEREHQGSEECNGGCKNRLDARSNVADSSSCNVRSSDSIKIERQREEFRKSSRPNGGSWAPEPAVGRVAHGIPNRMDRIRGLGNAIVPQAAYEIFNAISTLDKGK